MNAFEENMDHEGKTDHDRIVEMHTHLLGPNGVMERVKHIELKVQAVEDFKTKWATVATLIVGGITIGASFIKAWLVSLFTKGDH